MIMKSIKNIVSIFEKQKTDIYRNKKALLMFFIFPIMEFIYIFISVDRDLSSDGIFLVMNVIMPPITCMASTICEEREKGTLRCLVFAGVTPIEYFIGTGLCMGLFNFISTCLTAMIQNDTNINSVLLLGTAGIGIFCSMLIGAVIGLLAKKQVSVASLTAPVSLLLAMSALLGLSNPHVHKYTQFFYSQSIIDVVMKRTLTIKSSFVIFINIIIFGIIFIKMYEQRKRTD